MKPNISFEFHKFFSTFTIIFILFLCYSPCSCSRSLPLVHHRKNAEIANHTAASQSLPLVDHIRTQAEFANHTAISDFRMINRRTLNDCPDPNPYIEINVSSTNSKLSDDQFVTVTISGVLVPAASDWVAMISPANSE